MAKKRKSLRTVERNPEQILEKSYRRKPMNVCEEMPSTDRTAAHQRLFFPQVPPKKLLGLRKTLLLADSSRRLFSIGFQASAMYNSSRVGNEIRLNAVWLACELSYSQLYFFASSPESVGNSGAY